MADLIYGIPQELLDDWFKDSDGDNYSVAKLRVIDSGTAALLAQTITNQAQLIDFLLKSSDTQGSILMQLRKQTILLEELLGMTINNEDLEG